MDSNREDLRTQGSEARLLPFVGISHRSFAANNVTNLLLDDVTKKAVEEKKLDWYDLEYRLV